MLIVHHLGASQSERIVWLCEELAIPYELKVYSRTAIGAAPPEYKALHPFGAAPVIQDGAITLAESGAIAEYICRKHANGRLLAEPRDANYADFLYWFHFANGTFVPSGMMALTLPGEDAAARSPMRRTRYELCFKMIEERLGQQSYFAGPDFTAADIMMVYPLTRARLAIPHDISNAPNTLAYLQRIGARPAYQRAVKKGDPNFPPNLT